MQPDLRFRVILRMEFGKDNYRNPWDRRFCTRHKAYPDGRTTSIGIDPLLVALQQGLTSVRTVFFVWRIFRPEAFHPAAER